MAVYVLECCSHADEAVYWAKRHGVGTHRRWSGDFFCFQRALPGPVNGTLEGQAVQFVALLFNHYPGKTADSCFLLFFTDGGARSAPWAIAPAELVGANCSDPSLLQDGAQLNGYYARLSVQVRAPYASPGSCADIPASVFGDEPDVAPWLHGKATLTSGVGNVTVAAQWLAMVGFQYYRGVSQPSSTASVRCFKSVANLSSSESVFGELPSQQQAMLFDGSCVTFARNFTLSPLDLRMSDSYNMGESFLLLNALSCAPRCSCHMMM